MRRRARRCRCHPAHPSLIPRSSSPSLPRLQDEERSKAAARRLEHSGPGHSWRSRSPSPTADHLPSWRSRSRSPAARTHPAPAESLTWRDHDSWANEVPAHASLTWREHDSRVDEVPALAQTPPPHAPGDNTGDDPGPSPGWRDRFHDWLVFEGRAEEAEMVEQRRGDAGGGGWASRPHDRDRMDRRPPVWVPPPPRRSPGTVRTHQAAPASVRESHFVPMLDESGRGRSPSPAPRGGPGEGREAEADRDGRWPAGGAGERAGGGAGEAKLGAGEGGGNRTDRCVGGLG